MTTLMVAVPLLVASLLLAKRGSRVAQAVWLGALAYSLYNYAYYVFGASFNVPSLVIAGILLWRRTASGFLFGTAMAVMGAIYQVNLLMAGLYQANADVSGVKAFPLEGIVLAICSTLAALALLLHRNRR